MSDSLQHQSVLTQELIEHLAIQADGIYIDATFGRGGHSREILNRLGDQGRLIAIDRDPEAIAHAQQHFADDPRFTIEAGPFSQLLQFVEQHGLVNQVNGILLDLGVSSPQLDDPERGFSFMKEGPLDMRMDPERGESVAEWIATAKADEMATVFFEYGEERFARRIARAIVEHRANQAITTTTQLAEIVKAANPKWEKHKHPATRVFQALRIFINRELDELQAVLHQCLTALTIGGRLAVISFHSLEDRIVKRFIRQQERGQVLPAEVPVTDKQIKRRMRRIGGGAIKPSAAEVSANPRARSAVLRVGEKLS